MLSLDAFTSAVFHTEVLKVSRLPRKIQRRQIDPVRRQASADISGGAESKSSLMCCCLCLAVVDAFT